MMAEENPLKPVEGDLEDLGLRVTAVKFPDAADEVHKTEMIWKMTPTRPLRRKPETRCEKDMMDAKGLIDEALGILLPHNLHPDIDVLTATTKLEAAATRILYAYDELGSEEGR